MLNLNTEFTEVSLGYMQQGELVFTPVTEVEDSDITCFVDITANTNQGDWAFISMWEHINTKDLGSILIQQLLENKAVVAHD
jgi:hypothetical protein